MNAIQTKQIMMRRHRRAAGFGLIEVLIALVVISIGLLGLAGLQIASLKYTGSAGTRFEATNLGYEILDRMRANRTQNMTGAYDVAIGAAAGGTGLANTDVAAWKTALAQLPGGDGSVVTVVATRMVTVTVQWSESIEGTTSTRQVLMRTRL